MIKKIKHLCINLLVLLALLTIIDPFFGGEDINQPSKFNRGLVMREYPPNTDTYVNPPLHYIEETEFLEQKKYRLRTDKNGFIIGENKVQNEKVDIIFFGGSTTECLFVDENKRFPYLVGQQLINKETGQALNVFNAGISHSHSKHSTVNLLGKGLELNPELVVWMHNINDLTLLSKTGNYQTAPPSRDLRHSFDSEQAHSLKPMKRIEYFFTAARELFFPNIYFRLATLHYEVTTSGHIDEWSQFRNGQCIDFEISQQEFKQSLLTFIEVAKVNSIEVVLMTQFNRIKPEDELVKRVYSKYHQQDLDYDTFCKYYEQFNEIIRTAASEKDLLLIDLARLIEPDKQYLCDAVHLNNKGSIRVANIISRALSVQYPDFTRNSSTDFVNQIQ